MENEDLRSRVRPLAVKKSVSFPTIFVEVYPRLSIDYWLQDI